MKVLMYVLIFIASTLNNAYAVKNYTTSEIEQYLSSLKSFSAKFDQMVPGEDFARGTVYISKPGKFLWQYNIPASYKIISNGGFAYFIDDSTGQTTQIPSAGIFFSLLTNNEVNFAKSNIDITNLTQDDNRVTLDLTAKIHDTKAPITLIFQKLRQQNKLSLLKIIVKNQLEQSVMISLYEQNENANIDKKLFKVEIENEEIR